MLSLEMQEKLIRVAMEEAEKAMLRGDYPVGGLIADKCGNIIVRDGNRQNTEVNPLAHAEMVLIREAVKKLNTTNLSGYISVCSAESCPMCASAMIMVGMNEFYFGTHLEDSFHPFIPMSDIANYSSAKDIIIAGGILGEECLEIILRGR